MANLIVKNASGSDVEIQATGTGTTIDPFVMSYSVSLNAALPAGTNNIGAVTSIVPTRTPTTTNVSSSATSVTVLASNASRRGMSFWNNSTATLYLSASGTATVANAMFAVPPQGLLILDQQLIFTGAITGIWSAANGSVNVTEFV